MGFFDFLFKKKQQQDVDFKQLAKEGAILLDVRTVEEFNAGHLDGAKNIAVQVIENHLDEIKEYDKLIIAYCRSGRRSGNAAKIMLKAGINAVNGGGYEDLKLILK